MSEFLICPQGHRWNAAGAGALPSTVRPLGCPVCGESAEPPTAPPTPALTAAGEALTLPPGPPATEVTAGDHPHVIGYDILSELGRGGMGVVLFPARAKVSPTRLLFE